MTNAKAYCQSIELKDRAHKISERNFLVTDNSEALVSLKDTGFELIYEPSIMKDYQYLLREGLIDKVGRISEALQEENKTLVIRSAWRSFAHQLLLWERSVAIMRNKYPNKSTAEIHLAVSYFVAPYNKSTHATGGAIDALIHDNKTNQILDFGTNDGLKIDLSEKCYPLYPDIDDQAKENRALLMGLFQKEGFICDLKEYWHFDYGNLGWAIEKGSSSAFYGIIAANDV